MRGRGKQWIGFLIMVIGTGLLLGPFVLGDLGTREQERTVAELREMLRPVETISNTEASTIPTTEPSLAPTVPVTEVATAPTEPITETTAAPTEPVTEAAAVPTESVTEPAAIPSEPVTEPTTVPIEQVTEATTIPAELVTEPITAPTEPVTEPTTAPTEPTTIPTTAPAEPTAEPTTLPTEPPTEPVTEQKLPTYPLAGEVAHIAHVPEPEPAPQVPTQPLTSMEQFYQDAVAYNENLLGDGQNDMYSLYALEHFQLDARDYGFREDVVGTICIPRIDVEVPLYLGASSEHMGKGFAVFGRSSLPLGEGVENVAIAGHRGWRGTAMLRDVQQILIGDPVYITTPWRDLTYIVTAIEVVGPNNVGWCRIHPDKTMISLMTCHPYGENTHRYIVYAELEEEPKPAASHCRVLTSRYRPDPDAPIPVKPAETPVPATVSTEPVLPVPEAPVISVTEPTAPRIETSAPALPIVEAATPSLPVTEPTTPAISVTQPTIPTVPVTLPDVPVIPETVPTEPIATTEAVSLPAEAAREPAPARERRKVPATESTVPVVQEIVFVHDDGTREVILMDTAELAPDEREFTTQWSDTMIFAEDSMRPVAFVTAGIVALVGLWLLAATIRDAKNDKRGKKHDKE